VPNAIHKNGDSSFKAVDKSVMRCKSVIDFLFLMFSICHTVNWCDKLCFFLTFITGK